LTTHNALILLVTANTPTACWKHQKTKIEQNDNSYNIKIYAKYSGEPCIQIPGKLETLVQLKVEGRKKFTLIFRQIN